MTGPAQAGDTAAGRAGSLPAIVLSALLLTMLALRLHLALRLNINWDEFHSLAILHDFLRGAPLAARQTFHVHLFGWLVAIWPADEVSQIVAARAALFGLGLLTSGLIFLVGRRFLSTTGALFAVLCYNALAEVIVHGASFRPDPMATFLLLAATAAVLARRAPTAAAVAAGAFMALSFMLTPKTVFFLPGLAILVLTPTPAPGTAGLRPRLLRLAVLAASTFAFMVLLGVLHRQTLVSPEVGVSQATALRGIATKVFWTGYWFPGRFYVLRSFEQNALVWILLAGGLTLAVLGLRKPGVRGTVTLPLLALALPLGTLVFYRNSFPYFLAYILAPAMLLCGLGVDRLRRLESGGRRLGLALTMAVILGVFVSGLTSYLRQLPNDLASQRQLIATIHRMFPEPVPYIDRCSMISSFPKVGFFMSTWGMEAYARNQRGVLADAVREHAPPFLIANTLPLNLLLTERQASRLRYRLLEEDRQALLRNYIHHWGLIFVAGKRLEVAAGETELSILIPGSYTLEAEIEIRIDGRPLRPGEAIELTTDTHLVAAETPGVVALRWGDRLYRPDSLPLRQPIFVDL